MVLGGASQPLDVGRRRYRIAVAQRRALVVRDGAYAVDELGNVLGGVRTPAVDAAVERLSGFAPEGASLICQLFGSTTPLPAGSLRARWGSVEEYLAAYSAATEAMIAAGFACPEDRDALLSEARPQTLTQDQDPS